MNPLYDIALVGAGPIGLTLALGFGRAGLRVAMVDRVAREAMLSTSYDGRTTALSQSSFQLLNGLGAWAALAPVAEPILDIKVCDSNVPVMLDFDHSLLGTAPMGHIVENRLLRASLAAQIDSLPEGRLTWLQASVEDIETDAHGATLTLSDGGNLRARLVVAADGKFSPLRARLGIQTKTTEYGQTAIVTVIRHQRPHGGVALERFYPGGPFAVLPMKDDAGGTYRSSIVWAEPDAAARFYKAADAATFHAALAERVGGYLGEFEVIGGRWTYPLILQSASSFIAPRAALAGDTAHAMHPIAGQGVNLGMRDVALLLELVVDAARLGQDIGSEAVLAEYTTRRRTDVRLMLAATDGLTRLFSNHSPLLKAARSLGLGLFEKVPPLKRGAMRYAMGVAGKDAPRLLKGEAL